jgi:hypothetical protein
MASQSFSAFIAFDAAKLSDLMFPQQEYEDYSDAT